MTEIKEDVKKVDELEAKISEKAKKVDKPETEISKKKEIIKEDVKKPAKPKAEVTEQTEKVDKPEARASKKEEIVKAIEGMNVLELTELIKELGNRFGVQAIAPQVSAQAPAPSEKKAEEEKVEFNVILSEAGSKKIQVIKELRKVTSLGLKEAKDLVEQAPKPVKEGVSKEEALKIKEILEAAGAKVELK